MVGSIAEAARLGAKYAQLRALQPILASLLKLHRRWGQAHTKLQFAVLMSAVPAICLRSDFCPALCGLCRPSGWAAPQLLGLRCYIQETMTMASSIARAAVNGAATAALDGAGAGAVVGAAPGVAAEEPPVPDGDVDGAVCACTLTVTSARE